MISPRPRTAWFFATLLVALGLAPVVAEAQDRITGEGATVSAESSASSGGERVGGGIEEIVVRARRRAELLEDTPIAVTALNADNLDGASITRVDRIEQLVPNLTFNSGAAGQTVQLSVRGVGTTGGTGVAFDPGVGLYIDGVFLPRAFVSVFDVVDIQQIEVLRGPQGTLFGKNTVGGAVSVTTTKPQEELEGFASVRVGNLNAVRTRAVLNIPVRVGWLEDKLFTRFTFASRNREGEIFNEVRDERGGGENGLTFIGALRFRPTDDLTIDVSGTYFEDHITVGLGECEVLNEGGLGAGTPGFFDSCRNTGPRRIRAGDHQIANGSHYGVWGSLLWEIGDVGPLENVAVKTVHSWREQLSRSRTDLDGTEFDVLQIANIGGGPADGKGGIAEQIQQEVQVTASAWDGRLNVVSGVFGFWETADRVNGLRIPAVNQTNANRIQTDNWTWAVFGQATLDPTDWLSLTGGIRYTEDKKGAAQRNTRLDPATGEFFETGRAGDRAVFSSWTPMASVALKAPESVLDATPLDHLMTYFTYARGFKGGGLNAVVGAGDGDSLVPFDPETLDNFEVGVKTIAFDRRLTVNVAVFDGSYDDIQRTILRTTTDEEGNLQSRNLTLNAAKATLRGIELEFTANPIERLQVMGSFGYIDTSYDSFENAISQLTGEVIDRTGESFTRNPSYQSFLAAQYSIPIAGDELVGGSITPRLEWSYRDRELFAGPEIPQAIQPGVHRVNARITYRFLEGRAEFALWGRNLTDKLYRRAINAGAVSATGVMQTVWALPRTYGVELSLRF